MARVVANLLLAIEYNEEFANNMQQCFKASEKIDIGEFETVNQPELISKKIATGKYDILICQESFNSTQLGMGGIKEWQTLNKHLKVIMLVEPEKKYGKKLANMYSKGYYDALYMSQEDFTFENIENLICVGRTKEEAKIYYGVTEEEPEETKKFSFSESFKGMKEKVENAIFEDVEDDEEDENVEEFEEDVPEIEVTDDSESDDEYENYISNESESNYEENSYHYEEQVINKEINTMENNNTKPAVKNNLTMPASGQVIGLKCKVSSVITDNIVAVEIPSGGMTQLKDKLQDINCIILFG